jgi:titin
LSFKQIEKPVVEWYKGKNKIESTGRHEFSFDEKDGKYSLVIDNVSMNDTGIYKCIVLSEGREIPIRCDLRIKEKEFSPRFIEDLDQEPIIFQKGKQISKRFTIQGSPSPFVTWYKHDVPLFDTRRIDIRSREDSYNLSIREARAEDSGTYKCEASNNQGTAFRTFDFKVEGNKRFK